MKTEGRLRLYIEATLVGLVMVVSLIMGLLNLFS